MNNNDLYLSLPRPCSEPLPNFFYKLIKFTPNFIRNRCVVFIMAVIHISKLKIESLISSYTHSLYLGVLGGFYCLKKYSHSTCGLLDRWMVAVGLLLMLFLDHQGWIMNHRIFARQVDSHYKLLGQREREGDKKFPRPWWTSPRAAENEMLVGSL